MIENIGQRPTFEQIRNSSEFNNWYWKKSDLVDICIQAGLPYGGSKFELRDRILFALDNPGKEAPLTKKKRPTSTFNWAREELHLDTIITDSVSFGPNFRNFMKSQIGPQFSCHSDFMNWVKQHPGKSLADAVFQWHELEARKEDPDFRRDIARHNNYNQYMRDFLDHYPEKAFKDAVACWKMKKELPAPGGRVVFSPKDIELRPEIT
ncbi:DUF6434 domain-containing protein [Poritiphilus flavus]|uniref:DUF6434 domain-containing protein n=1 Tax=Poritiphilus flavus TaxID=2697053 RepID=A0A6L9EBK2_9FLAO|nr:DUF6434 domain-containing protein [Poritiphilus flavus]NAS12127.1 hypothetical protein [Poritiphilus flavus]